jgi:hypothetical protein
MGWGGTIGVALITTALGGVVAYIVAQELIDFLHITKFEGGAGYFAVFITLLGIIVGFLTGLISALAVRSDFWKAQGYAAGAIVVMAILATVLPAVLNDEGPTLDGEHLKLQVELKGPPGWKPDRQSRAQFNRCWLQEDAADAPEEPIVSKYGEIRLARSDGGWVATSRFGLNKTHSHHYARIFLGSATDISIDVPLPRHPGRPFKEWSGWVASGFYPQKDKPVPPGFTWRFRIRTSSEDGREYPDRQARVEAYRRERLDGVGKEEPLVKWLPVFEGPDGEPEPPPNSDAAQALLQRNTAELAQLLRSTDPNVFRPAVFAAAYMYPGVPESLIEPLAAAGERTVDLIREAAAADPDDPDVAAEQRAHAFYNSWNMAMTNAGKPAVPVRKAVLEKIERAALPGPKEGDIHDIAESARKDLDEIAAAK